VLQSCLLSPFFFNIFLEAVIAFALDNTSFGRRISAEILSNPFVDGVAVLAESTHDLQKVVDGIVKSSTSMGIRVNVGKTKTQCLG